MSLLIYLALSVLVAVLVLRYLEPVAIALPTLAVICLIVGGSVYVALYVSGGTPRPVPIILSLLGLVVTVAAVCGHFSPVLRWGKRKNIALPKRLPEPDINTVYVVQRLADGYWKDESTSPSASRQISAMLGKDRLVWRLIARTGMREEILKL